VARLAAARRGFTLVEIMIVVILFSLMAMMASELYQKSVQAERKIGVKIDLLHHAQVASLHISRELRHATEIIAPPESAPPTNEGDKTRPFIAYINELNEIIVIYVNNEGQLVKQNRNLNDATEVLGTGVSRLRAHRKGHRLLYYHLFLEDERNPDVNTREKFNLISGVTIRNSIH
jgi:prepilin-type N-terminal cleavage/methylation domain-containing protein